MSKLTSILTLNKEAETAVTWILSLLHAHGFHVERTFDLHIARLAQTHCPCPHHGTEDCSCQMVVLLIHGNGQQLVTIIIHGNESQTCISLVESVNQPAGTKVIELIEHEVATLEV
jgi:hypothetical protein